MTTPRPRPARSARALAALLVPLVALPALAGLVVCQGPDGPTTSWGERPCPKRQSATPVAVADDGALVACVVVPDADPAPLATAPDLRAPGPLAVAAVATHVPRPAEAPVALPSGPRGPPPGALRALRTVVLRV
ncbi:hypothetical protein [Rubrivirga marina]|uniref:hypothetical protein n=1 Tax=Rubrivirga marina TaxID=1196024 RepID=UPI000BA8DCFC|nr:hypothetical protein [Rubrivirga marina]